MKISKYCISKVQDCFTTSFLAIIIPIVFWFELWVVIPEVCGTESIQYKVHFIIGMFLLINIVGNFVFCIKTKTSIKGEYLTPPIVNENETSTWHFCPICDTMVPPRTWHCKTCRICILKRDHHCSFVGKCIGHKNQRYFVLMVVYLFISTIYSSVFNNYYIWVIHNDQYWNIISLMKIVFPMAAFVLQFNYDEQQVYFIIYIIITLGMIFTGMLAGYNIYLIKRGAVAYEKQTTRYNIGVKKNIRMVFGKRWYFAIICPFIKSHLPHNGINWEYLNRNQ